MRLLFLTSRLPYPPNRGDRLRVFNFIRSLSNEHEIHLISFISSQKEIDSIQPLNEYCRQIDVIQKKKIQSAISVGTNLWRSQPLQALYYRSREMQKLIEKRISRKNFDLIYIHLFRMAPYAANISQIYRIVDLTDVISQEVLRSLPYRGPISRLLYSFEHRRIVNFEQWVASNFDESWLISEHDQRILTANCRRSNVRVIRNGVDTSRFFHIAKKEQKNQLIFVGHMGVFHNVDAVKFLVHDILPLVWKSHPAAELQIVGAAPNPEVSALTSTPGVNVTGYVPDLNSALNQASIFVAPLRFAAGVQNKVLEAMASGKPVITSSLVNQGVNAKPGVDILVADTPEEFANQIIHLLDNEHLRNDIRESARKFVVSQYSWDLVADRIRNLHDELIQKGN